MRLTRSQIVKQFIGATSTASSIYAFTSLILFPILLGLTTAYGLPFFEGLFSKATAIVVSSLTGCGLLGFGMTGKAASVNKKSYELKIDIYTGHRIRELFERIKKSSKDSAQTVPQEIKPDLKKTRSDINRIAKAGFTQATTIWAVSSVIFIPLFALPPLGLAAITLSSLLALSFGLYYAYTKSKEIDREKIRQAEYKTAETQFNCAKTIQQRHDPDCHQSNALSETVALLNNYNKEQKWAHRKSLAIASLFGAMTGSSVATILVTLILLAVATTPVGWLTGIIALGGALFMGCNNYQVQQDKLNRERNLALARAFRSKTEGMLKEVTTPTQPSTLTPERQEHFRNLFKRISSRVHEKVSTIRAGLGSRATFKEALKDPLFKTAFEEALKASIGQSESDDRSLVISFN